MRSSPSAGAGSRRILLVDANAFASAAAIETLRAAGSEVETAPSAEVALARLESFDADTVVTELELGGKDGAWLLAQLAAMGKVDRQRRIVLTRAESLRRSLDDLGLDALVLKPSRAKALLLATGPAAPSDDARDEDLVRELVGLSVFGGELPRLLTEASRRLARAFRVDECMLLVATGDTPRFATAGELDVITLAQLQERCAIATLAGAPLYAADKDPYQTYLAAPLGTKDARVGSLLLCSTRLRRFSARTVATLRSVAERLGAELAWRAIHERIAADHDRLRVLSRVDPMLGVWNRTALDQELPILVASAARRREPITMAILDVAALRRINDRHGHAAGDAALRHVAATLRRELRAQDLVARYAGDALAVVLPGTPLDHAAQVINRLQRGIASAPLQHDNVVIPLVLVAGVAELVGVDDTGEAAMGRALTAQLQARASDRPFGIADVNTAPTGVPDAGTLEAGATLAGSYRILHEISRGAFGVVYRAEDLGLGRPVAVKMLRPDLARESALTERFRREAAMLAAIRHDNLVAIHAYGRDGDDVYFVMELVEGESLEDRVLTAKLAHTDISFAEVGRIIGEVAAALEAAHGVGILHRDVKPGNVLLDRVRGRAVLVDVGMAIRHGRTGKDPGGTPGFTAPEGFADHTTEAPTTDVYGLAALAYMMLTLEAPFGEGPPLSILRRQAKEPPPRPSEIKATVPRALDDILQRALDPDPAKRPQTIREFADAFAAIVLPNEPHPHEAAGLDSDFSHTRLMWGRDVRPPAPALSPDTHRHGFRTGEQPIAGSPHTRAVLFRSVYRVLGARRGGAWMSEVSRRDEALGRALEPQGAPLAWHPTRAFLFLLRAFEGGDPKKFAHELGRVATRFTFSLFYGADPSTQEPAHVLKIIDLLWHCYHSWGAARADVKADQASVVVERSLGDALLCASTAGILEQIITIAGGEDVSVAHPKCGTTCTFQLRWR